MLKKIIVAGAVSLGVLGAVLSATSANADTVKHHHVVHHRHVVHHHHRHVVHHHHRHVVHHHHRHVVHHHAAPAKKKVPQ